MTHPTEPPVDPMAPPVASPSPGASAMDDEIRQLARALNITQQEALSGRKATIDSVSLGDASTPPTVQVDLGGILIPSVRIAASYTPTVGDTVLLLKQGNEFFAAFKIAAVGSKSDEDAGGWIAASLDSSHATQGSATVMYRRINDHGSWKMQWKGALDYGSDTNLLASALAAEYRPSVARQVTVAVSVAGSNELPTARLDANTDGTLTFYGLTPVWDMGTSDFGGVSNHTHGGSTGFTDPPGDGFANSHAHSIPSSDLTHTHYLGTLNISTPPWVSLDGVEYFL